MLVYCRIRYIIGLVNTQFLKDGLQFFYNHFIHSRIYRIVSKHIVGCNGVLLADTVHTTDTLLDAHGVPGQIVVEHYVAELHV